MKLQWRFSTNQPLSSLLSYPPRTFILLFFIAKIEQIESGNLSFTAVLWFDAELPAMNDDDG